jgi:Kdo2-lipid IVA lauroyltransferase/acyltransferase
MAWSLYVLSYPWVGRERRLIQSNVFRVYGLPAQSEFSKTFVRQNMMTQMIIILETIKGIFRPDQYEVLGADAAKVALEAAGQNTGVVMITAHLGSWEMAAREARRALGRPFHALAKPSKSKWLTPILNQVREKMGVKILWTDSKTLLREMLKIADSQEHLGFVMDQRPGNRQAGHPCVFLGVADTHIVPGPVLMAIRKNLPVCAIYLVRTGPCQYRVHTSSILPAGHGETDHQKVAQMMADDMSRMIMMYPEQWSWNYRRWK